MDAQLRQKIDDLPQSPGCYLMRDRRGTIVYIGKAVNLRSRVRSYFTRADTRAFVGILDELLGDVEVILVGSEKEALLLENELIKKHQPRFNVMLRDDKNFISLRLDVRQPYPRLEVVRRPKKDGARYFGPYSSATSIRETLRVVNRHFQLRTCSDRCLENRRRPCLQYQIGRCPGPCVYPVEPEDYRRHVEDVTLFLSGRADELEQTLRGRMKQAASELRFEDAAMLRDQLQAIARSLEKQRTVSTDPVDRDVFGLYREGASVVVQVLFVRKGKLTGARHFPFRGQELPDDVIAEQFVDQYYAGGREVPHEVLLPVELPDAAGREEWLSERRGERVHVLCPQRGDKVRLVEMARENAEHNFREWRRGRDDAEEALARLQRRLHLSRLPRRAECYDNSHLQGTLAVGSRVTFVDGEPDKSRYRHYRVRSDPGDDFAMMREVLTRRLARGKDEQDLPDLVVLDGGPGQLNVARAVLSDLDLAGAVDLCSLAKARVVDDEALLAARQGYEPVAANAESEPGTELPGTEHVGGATLPEDESAVEVAPAAAESPGKTGRSGRSRRPGRWRKSDVQHSPERVFLPGRKNPVVLHANSSELFFLQRLRDEAHRFAITFQRRLRREAGFRSVLAEIPGVGETRKRSLLRHFGSLRRIREATAEELALVEGFHAKLADEVFRFFHAQDAAPAADDAREAEAMALADAGLEDGEASEGAESAPEGDDARADEEQVLSELAEEMGAAPQATGP